MRLICAIFCATAAVGTSFWLPSVASATDVHCTADSDTDITRVDGRTACRAASGTEGRSHSAGFDGVGYANATSGAVAVGLGAAGGVGASEGVGGIPIAIGLGPDAIALTSLADVEGRPPAGVGLSIAMDGSRAQVSSTEDTVVCLGSSALAWNGTTGAGCLATPLGVVRSTPPDRADPKTVPEQQLPPE
ncbi:hypothetical protein OG225_33800 [Nocardia sp. NBC_01377]|uniref:DUF6764 family protein n=1 Tax=Nocardia sp. NBC_01377 TaxID=2903595 RepID=UPI00325175FE